MYKYLIFICLAVTIAACNQPVQKQLKSIEIKENWKLIRISQNDTFPAIVPGCVHLDLLEAKIIDDPFYRTNEKNLQWIDKEDWAYITEFEVNDSILNHEFVEFEFKGLDTYADVYLNDSLLLKTDNMFREWKLECKKHLKKGKNKLKIYFHSPIKEGLKLLEKNRLDLPAGNDQSQLGGLDNKRVSPFTRKAPYHYGWDWGPRFVSSGIWKPVILKAWSKIKIENIHFEQDSLSDKEALLCADVELISSASGSAILKIYDSKSGKQFYSDKVELLEGKNRFKLPFTIKNPKRWWSNGLGEAYLYHLQASVLIDGRIYDVAEHSIGLRTIEIIQEPDKYGKSFYVKLNGVPVFMKGANHIPNDIFLARVGPEIYEREIANAVESNMNMLRVWGGGIYEDDVFYDLCDKNGILVWQDFMFACSMYPGDSSFLKNVAQEAEYQVKRLRNHPSIALWCGNNEINEGWHNWGWQKEFKFSKTDSASIWNAYLAVFEDILPKAVNEFSPGTFYWPSSPLYGWGHKESMLFGDSHYWGIWWGMEPFSVYQQKVGRFMSEYGFQSFPEIKSIQKYALPEDFSIESEVMLAHQKSGIGNQRIKQYMDMYYRQPKDFEHFIYVGQLLQAEGIKTAIEAHRRAMPYCMGTLYWQMNDCWPVASWSGIDYYGNWKALQYFVKKAYNDLLVSPLVINDSLFVYLISDKLEKMNGKLSIEVYSTLGKKISEKSIDVDIEPNSSRIYFQLPIPELIKSLKRTESLIVTRLNSEGKNVSTNSIHLVEAKDLILEKPKIEKNVEKKGDSFKITIKADKFVKNAFLSFKTDNGHFSDNYFDLFPGQSYEIWYKPEKSDFDEHVELKIISLYDSYN